MTLAEATSNCGLFVGLRIPTISIISWPFQVSQLSFGQTDWHHLTKIMSVILFWKKQFIATLCFVGFRQNPSLLWLWSSNNLKFQFAGTMSRPESYSEAPELRELMPKFKVFMVHQKKTVWFLYIHFKGPHIFVQILCTHFWINFEFSSNYSLSKFIFIFYTPWYRLYAGEMIRPANRANHLGIWLSTFQPLPTLGGNSGLEGHIESYKYIEYIWLSSTVSQYSLYDA